MKKEELVVNGVGMEGLNPCEGDLKTLAARLKVGEKITGYYRYFLFGNKPCELPLELARISPGLAVITHLNRKHNIKIAKQS